MSGYPNAIKIEQLEKQIEELREQEEDIIDDFRSGYLSGSLEYPGREIIDGIKTTIFLYTDRNF